MSQRVTLLQVCFSLAVLADQLLLGTLDSWSTWGEMLRGCHYVLGPRPRDAKHMMWGTR